MMTKMYHPKWFNTELVKETINGIVTLVCIIVIDHTYTKLNMCMSIILS